MTLQPVEALLLTALGGLVGAVGTLIGAGGGFLLVPLLLFLKPDLTPAGVTSTSLAVVFVNAISGSYAYVRAQRVEFRLVGAMVPGVVLGALLGADLVSRTDRGAFSALFGLALVALAVYLFLRPVRRRGGAPLSLGTPLLGGRHLAFAGAFALLVGVVSAFLGIGGGILMVPMMNQVLRVPVHRATATSLFIVMATALTAVASHLARGERAALSPLTLALLVGVVVGAQIGAFVSGRMGGTAIVRVLALALLTGGIRLLMRGLGG